MRDRWSNLLSKMVVRGKKNKIGRLIEVYPSLFIVEYKDTAAVPGAIDNTYVESYTYSDILTEKTLIRYFDDESAE